MGTRAVRAAAAWVVLVVLSGCSSPGDAGEEPPPSAPPSTSSSVPPPASPTAREPSGREEALADARGLVYYVGRRARTGEPQLFAEQTDLRGRADLLAAVRAAMTDRAADPDYASAWGDDVVDRVKLWWDGDEGHYSVRLRDERAAERPPGMSMREAHLAIQQVVWTLGSVGRVPAPVKFTTGRSDEVVTDLLGIPATGPGETYLAADYGGVLGSMNILAPADGATVDGVVEVSGLGESFEATVGIRVTDAGGDLVVNDSTQADQCCGGLGPWTYTLDTTGWTPGTYVVQALTDDPVGIAQGSDGPQIDTKTITVR